MYWESFGKGWYNKCICHKIENDRVFSAPYGQIPDLNHVSEHDVIFTYNEYVFVRGVCVYNLNWISDTRSGLIFNDATSAVFAAGYKLDKRWDVTTYSWQKFSVVSGHGMIILSPRAMNSLETFIPNRPLPKIFELTKQVDSKQKINHSIFEGSTINTPSMLCIKIIWCT